MFQVLITICSYFTAICILSLLHLFLDLFQRLNYNWGGLESPSAMWRLGWGLTVSHFLSTIPKLWYNKSRRLKFHSAFSTLAHSVSASPHCQNVCLACLCVTLWNVDRHVLTLNQISRWISQEESAVTDRAQQLRSSTDSTQNPTAKIQSVFMVCL